MPNITLEQYNQLVNSIYEAGLDAGKWENFIVDLGKVLDGVFIALHGFDMQNKCDLGALFSRCDPANANSFLDYYAAINPWMAEIYTITLRD